MDFPYIELPGEDLPTPRPLVPVIFSRNGKRTSQLLTLIDSGADFSFAPFGVARHLGISFSKVKSRSITGFTGHNIQCFPMDVDITVAGKTIRMPIYFGGNLTEQYPTILGQDMFFTLTKITFLRKLYTVSIEWI